MVLQLETAKHRAFKRDGADLSMVLRLTLRQALLGFSRNIRHLDGHPVTVANEGVSQPHQVLTLRGEGMPVHGVPSEFGVLRVELMVDLPSSLTADERQWLGQHLGGGTDPTAIPTKQPSVFGG